MTNYSLNHTSSVSLGPQLVELRRVRHIGPGSLACTRLEIQECTETKTHTQTGTEECDGCVGDRKLSPLTGPPHCSPITLQLFQDAVCVCASAFFFTNPCQIYACIFNLKDLKFVIRIPRHSTRGPVSELRD